MRNNDFEFDDKLETDGFYYVNEGRLEERIFEVLQNKTSIESLSMSNDIDLDAYLSLTPLRKRLLSWYSFDKRHKVLEVGAGYGEITSLLCEKTKIVTAYEYKPEREKIIRLRCKDYDNLNIVTGELSNLKFDNDYDVIVIHDVLAIARKFFKGEEPTASFIRYFCNYIAPSGKIIICIENRIGLRYFSGSAEDYSRVFFWGLNEFDQDERYRTYSETELKNILKKCGLIDREWYYPFPNDIIPEEIFHKDIDDIIFYGVNSADNGVDSPRYLFFDERRMFLTLHREGLAYKFANAFIVECELNKSSTDEEIVAYVNFDKNVLITEDTSTRTLYCNGEILPRGVRADMALIESIKPVVDCNLGADNPHIKTFYRLLFNIYFLMEQRRVRLIDVYVDGLETNTKLIDTCDKFHRIKDIYDFYILNVSQYRNARRRLTLENVWKTIGLTSEEINMFLSENDMKQKKVNKLSFPSILFDFDAEDDKNSVFYSNLADNSLKTKLDLIHKGLFE